MLKKMRCRSPRQVRQPLFLRLEGWVSFDKRTWRMPRWPLFGLGDRERGFAWVAPAGLVVTATAATRPLPQRWAPHA